MRQGFIRSSIKTRPDGGAVEFFEIIELIGGREHRSHEGWSLKTSREDAVREAANRGIDLID